MSKVTEFKSKETRAKEDVIKHLRWLADAIENGEEYQWGPETVVIAASSPTNIPVFHVVGNQEPARVLGMLELTKDVIVANVFMEADAPPEGPEV